jgi:hypothetical protein
MERIIGIFLSSMALHGNLGHAPFVARQRVEVGKPTAV